MTATKSTLAPRLTPKTPPSRDGYRFATQTRPGGVPNVTGKATSTAATTTSNAAKATATAAKATAGTTGRVAGKAGVAVVTRVAVGRAVAGAGGALGGPAGTVVTTCAFEGGYQLGSELGRRNHPIIEPYPKGQNKILRKQPDGSLEWVDDPKPTQAGIGFFTRKTQIQQPLTDQQRYHKAVDDAKRGVKTDGEIGERAWQDVHGRKTQREEKKKYDDNLQISTKLDIKNMTSKQRQEAYLSAVAHWNRTIANRRATGASGPDPLPPVPGDFGL